MTNIEQYVHCRVPCRMCGEERWLTEEDVSEMTLTLPGIWHGWHFWISSVDGEGMPRVFGMCHECLFATEDQRAERKSMRTE